MGFDVVESPIGALLVAASDRGLCRIFFDAEPEQHLDCLARVFGPRVLRSAPTVDNARRHSTSTSRDGATRSSSMSISVAQPRSRGRFSMSSHASPTGRRRRTARSPAGSAPRGRPARSAR